MYVHVLLYTLHTLPSVLYVAVDANFECFFYIIDDCDDDDYAVDLAVFPPIAV